MGPRTPEQRAAFTAAKDTPDGPMRVLARIFPARVIKKVAKLAVLLSAVSAAVVLASRLGWLIKMRAALTPAAMTGLAVLKSVLNFVLGVLTGSGARSLGTRLLTRVIDCAVPAAVIILAISAIAGDDDEEPLGAETEESGGLLKKLLRGGKPPKEGAAPGTKYIRVQPLGDKLDSMAYSITATTVSTAVASRTQRKRNLSRRFGDELGDMGEVALAGVAAAEAMWRVKTSAVRMP